jgi:cobalamin synthase
VSLANGVWITAAHIMFFDQYITNHRQEAAMMTAMPLPDSPRTMMALMGPVVGLASGVVLGLFAVAASKIMSMPVRQHG